MPSLSSRLPRGILYTAPSSFVTATAPARIAAPPMKFCRVRAMAVLLDDRSAPSACHSEPVTEVTGVGIRIPGKGERIATTSLRTGLAMTRGGRYFMLSWKRRNASKFSASFSGRWMYSSGNLG